MGAHCKAQGTVVVMATLNLKIDSILALLKCVGQITEKNQAMSFIQVVLQRKQQLECVYIYCYNRYGAHLDLT